MFGFGNNLRRELNVGTLKARDMMQAGKRKAGRGAQQMAGLYKQKREAMKRGSKNKEEGTGGTLGREVEMQEQNSN